VAVIVADDWWLKRGRGTRIGRGSRRGCDCLTQSRRGNNDYVWLFNIPIAVLLPRHYINHHFFLTLYSLNPLELFFPFNSPKMSPSTIREISKVLRIACIPGDGIGVDITEAAVQVLKTLSNTVGGFEFDFTTFDWSSKNFQESGYYMPEDGMEQLKKFDAIYFGAVGWPGKP